MKENDCKRVEKIKEERWKNEEEEDGGEEGKTDVVDDVEEKSRG